MHRVDYDSVASVYDRRYEANAYDGIDATLRAFLGGTPSDVAEVGCGTGHWLRFAAVQVPDAFVVGIDLSAEMLAHARQRAPHAKLVRASAHALPLKAESLDVVFAINALHHFSDRPSFFAECARALRPGGALLTIGLDPHAGPEQWWIYDYFPSARGMNLARYASTRVIRRELQAAGFVSAATTVAQHLPARVSFEEAERNGLLDRRSTSQLVLLPDEEWKAGLARIRAERPELTADLRLYATTASTPSSRA